MVVHFESDASGAWNEMFSSPGVARPMYQRLLSDLESLDTTELGQRADQLSRTFIDRGVTFAHSGEERPFPLDLVCRANHVYMRTTTGERAVHVIYRRVDDDWLDPLQFRPNSVIGVAGLVNAARAGNVTISNGLGNGVADDKLVYTYVPEFIRYYLGEKPLLENILTYRLEEAEACAEVLAHPEQYVIKPVDGSGGKGIIIGPQASAEELAAVREAVTASPRSWIAQRPVALSTHPTFVNEKISPRHIDLRPFAVSDGSDVWVLPGGLTRVALGEGELIVNSSRGGGSKDTWVLSEEIAPLAPLGEVESQSPMASAPPQQNDEFIGQDEEQQ